MIEVTLTAETVMHMALAKKHILKSRFTIHCDKNNILNGAHFYCETITPKKTEFGAFGKPNEYYYWANAAKYHPTLDKFLKENNMKLKID